MTPSQPRKRLEPGDKRLTTCQLCAKTTPAQLLVQSAALRPTLNAHIAARHPDTWNDSSRACRDCLAKERLSFLMARLAQERGELSEVERETAQMAASHQTLAADIERQFEASSTAGQRVADRVAAVGGSWPFVLSFLAVLLIWVVFNSFFLRQEAFDPYPYILLNLFLSCLAAVQAPIIMMSQNRVSARDRMQADQDFRVNLKAEIEVSSLHEKVDHLLHSQWQRMVELQEMQIDLLNDLAARRK